MDDILPKQNSDTLIIKLQSDSEGRYGFNVKVIIIFESNEYVFFDISGWR
jgi:hypothetical protein